MRVAICIFQSDACIRDFQIIIIFSIISTTATTMITIIVAIFMWCQCRCLVESQGAAAAASAGAESAANPASCLLKSSAPIRGRQQQLLNLVVIMWCRCRGQGGSQGAAAAAGAGAGAAADPACCLLARYISQGPPDHHHYHHHQHCHAAPVQVPRRKPRRSCGCRCWGRSCSWSGRPCSPSRRTRAPGSTTAGCWACCYPTCIPTKPRWASPSSTPLNPLQGLESDVLCQAPGEYPDRLIGNQMATLQTCPGMRTTVPESTIFGSWACCSLTCVLTEQR